MKVWNKFWVRSVKKKGTFDAPNILINADAWRRENQTNYAPS